MSNHNLNSLNPMKFLEMGKNRTIAIENADNTKPNINKPANNLAKRLHPKVQHLIVDKIIDELDCKRYILKANKDKGTNELAYFLAGQYLSITVMIDNIEYNRPYSISSSPKESLLGFYEIAVKRVKGGLVSNYILDNWTIGTNVVASDPSGNFTYEPLRDSKHVVAIAGGSGITPFISLARAINNNDEECSLTLIYGCKKEEEILYRQELDVYSYTHPNINVIYVLSDEEKDGYEHGVITSEIIKKYAPKEAYSIFICGPEKMHEHLDLEIAKLNIENKYIRHEVFSSGSNKKEVEEYNVTVHQKGNTKVIKAKSNETLLQCFEKNGIKTLSKCRSGECGFCHSKLISGNIYIPDKLDRRRLADDIYGYIHPCCSYPISDIEIEIN